MSQIPKDLHVQMSNYIPEITIYAPYPLCDNSMGLNCVTLNPRVPPGGFAVHSAAGAVDHCHTSKCLRCNQTPCCLSQHLRSSEDTCRVSFGYLQSSVCQSATTEIRHKKIWLIFKIKRGRQVVEKTNKFKKAKFTIQALSCVCVLIAAAG